MTSTSSAVPCYSSYRVNILSKMVYCNLATV